MQGRKFKNLFSRDRKMLYMVFSIVLIFVFSLTIVYAALNAILRINGNAEISASSWDIKLDNVQLLSGSATTNVPVITDKTTATFTTTLTNPGDYYMFTIDVVNDGSIDAMIDSIEKTSTLTENQAQYLNYIVEYQSGESINIKQLVEKNSFVRLKIKVEFKKDISSSDLPSLKETLNLSFKVNYVQADENNTLIVPNDGKLVKVVSGDYDTVGSEVCIGNECFYIISSTENDVTMLAKYNLLVGNKYYSNIVIELENPTGIQDEIAKAYFSGYSADNPLIGTKPFSSTNYWSSTVSTYPTYVYNDNSYLYEYIENYKTYLESLGTSINDARLIIIEELEGLGCSRVSTSCSGAPSWIYSTTYWTGTANSSTNLWYVNSNSYFGSLDYDDNRRGVRPVIVIDRDLL